MKEDVQFIFNYYSIGIIVNRVCISAPGRAYAHMYSYIEFTVPGKDWAPAPFLHRYKFLIDLMWDFICYPR